MERVAQSDRGGLAAVESEAVAAYYEHKTESILRRYGPGPRVHFHTGFLDRVETPVTDAHARLLIRESQHRMLRDAARAWELPRIAPQHVLDVGCGLGGTAIFWAEEFGSDITAITNAPSHVSLVERFSAEAGVRSQVHTVLCDALEVPGDNRFDAIVAIESSCHLSRRPWFRRAAELLRSGGRLFIADCFLENETYKEPFDQHWCACIGTIEEYIWAAEEAGLVPDQLQDASRLAANFWATTTDLIRLEAQDSGTAPHDMSRFQKSIEVHSLMREGLLDGGYRHMLLSFLKPVPDAKAAKDTYRPKHRRHDTGSCS